MSYKDTVSRVWRETVASYGSDGINRPEAMESAAATLMVEVRAGRLSIDLDRAVRDALARADESDGRAADKIIERAAYGEVLLVDADLDVVVTLGAGMRKVWRDVSAEDLEVMDAVRFENFRKVSASYTRFNKAVTRIMATVSAHGTVGAAYDAGGFPPADLASEARAA